MASDSSKHGEAMLEDFDKLSITETPDDKEVEDSKNKSEEPSIVRHPTAKYNKLSEKLRHVTPGEIQCCMFCGGRKCKYENPSNWREDQMAVKGIFSHWVTDDILAMARPNTEVIEKYGIIEQFTKMNIKSIINLQKPGEHASCGNPLEESGFSYNPQIFMDNAIYFYNFGWKDYGVASLGSILDMVKVVDFAVSEGKVAVHCHAGLGRTGVLIACYLVYVLRMPANEAVHFVRSKRPNAIQTRGQILCIQEFSQYLAPLRIVFAQGEENEFTLNQYLKKQRHLLHGYEARRLRFIPKILAVICDRLLELIANAIDIHFNISESIARLQKTHQTSNFGRNLEIPNSEVHRSTSSDEIYHEVMVANCSFEQKYDSTLPDVDTLTKHKHLRCKNKLLSVVDRQKENPTTKAVVQALIASTYEDEVQNEISLYQNLLNESEEAWAMLESENNVEILAGLLWSWISQLKEPILRNQDLRSLVEWDDEPCKSLNTLEQGPCYTTEFLLKTFAGMPGMTCQLGEKLIHRLVLELTHRTSREGNVNKASQIFMNLIEIYRSEQDRIDCV